MPTTVELPRTIAAVVTTAGALALGKHNPVNATSGPLTMTLPAVATANAGRRISVEKTDSSANAVTIAGSIRGVASSTIALSWLSDSIDLVADATGSWWPVAGHKTKAALDRAYAPWTAPVPLYQASTTYATGALVSNQNVLCQAISGFTSGTTFDVTKWTQVGTLYSIPSRLDWLGDVNSGNQSYANLSHDASAGYIFHLTTGTNMTGGAVMAFGVGDGGATPGTGLLVSQKSASSGDAVSLVNQSGTTGNLLHLASQSTSGTGYGLLLEQNNTTGKGNTLLRLIANGTPGTGQNLLEIASIAQSGRGGFGANLAKIAADTGIIDLYPTLLRIQSLTTVQAPDTGVTGNVSKINLNATGANPFVQWAQYTGTAGLFWSHKVTTTSSALNFQIGTAASAVGSETWVTAISMAPKSGAAGLAFFGATVIAQPTRVGALTDSSTGTATSTVADVGGTYSQAGLNAIHASLIAKINAIEARLSGAAGGLGLTA